MANPPEDPRSPPAPRGNGPFLLTRSNVIATAILLASCLWLIWWFWDRSNYVFVSDARISATIVTVSARVAGRVRDFPIDEGQTVSKDQQLGEIDSRKARIRLAEIDAKLRTTQAEHARQERQLQLTREQITSRITAQKSRVQAMQSTLSGSRVALNQAKRDWRRAQSLLEQENISREMFEQRKANYDRARETLNERRAQLAEAEAALAEAEANRAQVEVLKAELAVIDRRQQELEVDRRRAKVEIEDHVIRSPVDGVVDKTFINAGEYVSAGQRIVMVHNPENIWVSANVKETEIRHVQPGSAVIVEVDALPGKPLEGEIVRVGHAATSEFSLLPTPNPSGNFTKITQRFEVKVDIDQIDGFLKPGMMVELKIVIE
ncbi:MAG: HlyD family secretion protein [Pseudomonadales bacterium]